MNESRMWMYIGLAVVVVFFAAMVLAALGPIR